MDPASKKPAKLVTIPRETSKTFLRLMCAPRRLAGRVTAAAQPRHCQQPRRELPDCDVPDGEVSAHSGIVRIGTPRCQRPKRPTEGLAERACGGGLRLMRADPAPAGRRCCL